MNGQQEKPVVELHDEGLSWPEIAEALDTDVDDAMQRYRDEMYDHWDTGWERTTEDGQARVSTGAIELWTQGDTVIQIEEISRTIPLTVIVDDEETRTLTNASLTADQARDLAATLHECADILESKTAAATTETDR